MLKVRQNLNLMKIMWKRRREAFRVNFTRHTIIEFTEHLSWMKNNLDRK